MRHKVDCPGPDGVRCGLSALALVLLLCAVFVPTSGMAQTNRDDSVRMVMGAQPVGIAEAALASCAGGAMIGYLLVVTAGPGSPAATATLFCGLSAAATVTSSVTFWAWRTVKGLLP